MLVYRRVTPNIKLGSTHLYTWVERGTVRIKCLAQEYNTLSLARAQTQTAQSGVKPTDHEATVPPQCENNAFEKWKVTKTEMKVVSIHYCSNSLVFFHHRLLFWQLLSLHFKQR